MNEIWRDPRTVFTIPKQPRISVSFAWYDCWVGFYYDRKNKILFVCPLPMVVIKINFHAFARRTHKQETLTWRTIHKPTMVQICTKDIDVATIQTIQTDLQKQILQEIDSNILRIYGGKSNGPEI